MAEEKPPSTPMDELRAMEESHKVTINHKGKIVGKVTIAQKRS